MLKTTRIHVLVVIVTTVGIMGGHIAHGQETAGEKPGMLYHSPAEKRELTGITLMDGVSVGALLEAEASFGKDAGDDVSDVVLATFELDIDADLNEWARGHALLLWEEDDTEPVDLDEATITLGGTEGMPAYISAGKMYIPFGAFNSHFVSDPLVQELGETRESAILVGYGNSKFELQATVFNGDLDDGDDHADNTVVSATLTPFEAVRVGASWISDIGESEALQELTEEALVGTPGLNYEEASGVGAFLSLTAWKLVLDAEYVAATDDFGPQILGEEALRPAAWNTELAFHSGERWEVAAKVEGSHDFPGFPETQYGVAAAMAISDSTTLAIEYLHGEYDGESPGRNMATCQLSLEF